MRILSFILTIVFGSLPLYSESMRIVTGKVTDAKHEAIPFATIIVEGTSEGTAADSEGRFELTTTAPNNLVLVVASMGYNEERVAYNVNHSENITITLASSSHSLDEVMVRGNSKAAQIERSGFAVSSIDMTTMSGKSVEINDVLEQTPGLKVRRDGGLGSSTTYNINGLSGDAVRIFIDGVPMESFGSSYSVNSIPVSLIERVDVYKGVVPIEFGNDAMGGAINIVTKKQSHNTLNASYSFGSFNTHRAALGGSIRNTKTGISAKASVFYNYSDNNYKVWSDDVIITDDRMYLDDGVTINPEFGTIERGVEVERFHNAYQSYGVKAGLGITDKPWVDQLFLDINASKDYKEIQHGATMLSVYGERFSESFTIAPSINYNKNNLFVDGLNFSSNLQYSFSEKALTDTTRNSYNWYGDIRPPVVNPPVAGETGTATLNIDENSSYIGRFNLAYVLNENNTIGLSYSDNHYLRHSDDEKSAPEVRSYGTVSIANKKIVGLSYQNVAIDNRLHHSIFTKNYSNTLQQDKVEMNNGILDTISVNSTFANWGFGFTSAFELSPKVQISASAENAVRLVGADEVFGNVASNIVESLDLKPETSINVNLGTKITPLNSNYYQLDISGNLFLRNTKDKIRREAVVTADMDEYMYTNVGHVISKGVELEADLSIGSKWNFSLQGYYLDSRFKEETTTAGEIDLRYNSREPNVPFLTASASASRHFDNAFAKHDRLSVSWYSSYVHEFYFNWEILGSQNKEMVPKQFINDISMSYTFPKKTLRLSLDGKNIFNTMAFDNYAIQKPGRAVYIKLSYQL